MGGFPQRSMIGLVQVRSRCITIKRHFRCNPQTHNGDFVGQRVFPESRTSNERWKDSNAKASDRIWHAR